MKHVDIYTDGACKFNPGPGGYAAILVYNGREKEVSGGEASTTNNRMELLAAINGLKMLKEACEVTLYSDSKYLIDSVEKGWSIHGRKTVGARRTSPLRSIPICGRSFCPFLRSTR